tara:strand:- start:82484 stop:85231 length:2748 start_codon:yes stop_codon:yes gene_type:complete
MASPFSVFRRNQKILTVVLTCLAMFAFIILDSVSKMDSSAIMPIIFGLIGAALAWLWGSQNERGISYSTIAIGGVLGAAAGAVIISQSANQGGITTAHGRLSISDLNEMKQNRDMANQFVLSVFRSRKEEVHPMVANYYLNQYQFGDTSGRAVVARMLLEREADELGIEISDEFVTNYIKTISDNSMTRETLTKIRGQLRLGEAELYDLLRSELRARVASRVLNPEIVHMPDQYWGDFEKLNVRHSIDAVGIPVEPFAARLPRPSDAEINEVFEAFKGFYPMGENPGFIQPDRLKLAWFESDYEAAEKLVGEIPEEELKARYEERKDIEYKIETLPDLDSGFDDGGLKFGEPPAPVKTSEPVGDAEATDDAAKADDTKADPAAKTDDAAPADSPASEEAKPSEAKPSEAEPSEEECGDGDDQEPDVSKDDAPKNDAPKDEKAAAKPVETPATESKSADESKPASESGTDAAAPEEPTETPAAGTEKAATPDPTEVKYRSFEEVRDEIRDLLLREKTEERIEKQIAVAIAAVKDWRFTLREENPDLSDEDLAAGIAAKAKIYAAENGLKFVSVDDFLSQQELIEHSEYKIGTAREPFDPSNFMAQSQPQTVAARLFTGATTLFVPEEAQGQFDDTRYAFWATVEKEQHVPTLDEPGVREQVEEAVRLKNARPLAEARAKAVAESLAAKFAESSIVTMAEGIADQSVFGPKKPKAADPAAQDAPKSEPGSTETESTTESEKEESCGDEEGAEEAAPADSAAGARKPEVVSEAKSDEAGDQPLSVISTPPFTWLRQSSQGMQMNPFGQPSIEFGFIPGIDDVDDNFMKTVSETPVGQVVVIPNATKQIYYVVYVKARNPSGDDDPSLAPVRQQFITENAPMSPIYSRLAESQGGSVNQAWQIQFFAKHNVSIEELDAI